MSAISAVSTGDILAASYAEVVRKSGLLDGVAAGLVESVVAGLRPRPMALADGEPLCHEADSAGCLWIVVKGRVSVLRQDCYLADRAPPYIVGDQALIKPGQKRSATLQAVGMAEVLRIERPHIEALPEGVRATIWRNIAGIVSEKLCQATVWRSEAIDRDRENQGLLRRFLNSHQQGFIRAQGPITRALHQPRPERGRFVLIFSDVVGFSRLTLEVGDDDIAAGIQACMKAQSDAIEAADGYVDKFMGDGMMAYFIVPDGAGDADLAEITGRALDAAFEAVAGVTAIPVTGKPLGLRVGLHLGEALAGNFGSDKRMQVTLLGADVNTAARLEQAKPDALVGDHDGVVLGDVRVSGPFYDALPEEKKGVLPYRGVVKAKQGEIPLHYGPSRLVVT